MGLEVINERASFQIVKGPIPLNEAGGAFIQFKQFKILDFNDDEITIVYNNVKRIISRENKATFSEMLQIKKEEKTKYGSKVIVFTVI